MLRVSFSPCRDRVGRHYWISCFCTLGKTAARVFVLFTYFLVNDPFVKPPGRNTLLSFQLKSKKIIKHVFFSNLFAPWRENFADAGDGDGGGDNLGPFLNENSNTYFSTFQYIFSINK